MKKKSLALVLALALMVVGAVGGTLAWLTAKSDVVTNTFTTSNITVKLEETEGETVEGGREFKMVPGCTIEKDPKATVVTGSEKCYLFVKLDESANFGTYLTYNMAGGWLAVPNETNVYYRVVDGIENQFGTPYSVLENDQVTVMDTVTKADMENLNKDGATKPTLTITAYASQLYKNNTERFEPAEAWEKVKPVNP